MLSYICLQIVEEAGGTVSCMDGEKFSVFDRSVLVSNGILHSKVCFLPFATRFAFGYGSFAAL